MGETRHVQEHGQRVDRTGNPYTLRLTAATSPGEDIHFEKVLLQADGRNSLAISRFQVMSPSGPASRYAIVEAKGLDLVYVDYRAKVYLRVREGAKPERQDSAILIFHRNYSKVKLTFGSFLRGL